MQVAPLSKIVEDRLKTRVLLFHFFPKVFNTEVLTNPFLFNRKLPPHRRSWLTGRSSQEVWRLGATGEGVQITAGALCLRSWDDERGMFLLFTDDTEVVPRVIHYTTHKWLQNIQILIIEVKKNPTLRMEKWGWFIQSTHTFYCWVVYYKKKIVDHKKK